MDEVAEKGYAAHWRYKENKHSNTKIQENLDDWVNRIRDTLEYDKKNAVEFVDDFKLNLAMSLSTIINILDPDAFIFGGGVSNEIDFLLEIDALVRKFVIGREYEGVFLKPKYGDASGVRGAARLGRSATY